MKTSRRFITFAFVGCLFGVSLAFGAAKDDVTLFTAGMIQAKQNYGCDCGTSAIPWILKNAGNRTVIVTVVVRDGSTTKNAKEHEILAGDTKCLECREARDGSLEITGARYK
jgi:hypothetical protein